MACAQFVCVVGYCETQDTRSTFGTVIRTKQMDPGANSHDAVCDLLAGFPLQALPACWRRFAGFGFCVHSKPACLYATAGAAQFLAHANANVVGHNGNPFAKYAVRHQLCPDAAERCMCQFCEPREVMDELASERSLLCLRPLCSVPL